MKNFVKSPVRSARVSALVMMLLFYFSAAAGSPPDAATLEQRVDKVKTLVFGGPALVTLRQLSEQFGPRLTGSPAYDAAADWAIAQFRQMGINDVKLEQFTIPNGWRRGKAEGRMYSPFEKSLHIEPVGWSPSTAKDGIRANVVAVSDIGETALRSSASTVRGRVVLLDAKQIFAMGFKTKYADFVRSYSVFKELGALGLLLPGETANNAAGDWVDTDNGEARVLPLPVAEIGMEDAKLIFDLLKRNTVVSVQFNSQNEITGPVKVSNVIANMRGSEAADEWVLLGAHLDSWDLGMGAQDNGTGSVMVLETARALSALGSPPRRSVRFALWTGEEPGLLGSKAYVKAHIGELKEFTAVLNTDAGAGKPLGWKVDGRRDLMEAVREQVSPNLEDLGADGVSLKINVDTDHAPFMLQGIPALDLWVDTSHYEEVAHKSGDTFDKVDPINLKADAGVVAATTLIIADLPQPIAPHIDHARVYEIIKDAGLEGYLVAHGDWQP